MSDANRTQIAYVAESTFGQTPVSPDMQEFEITGESLGFNIDSISSNTIRADRNIKDLIQTGAESSGDLNFELSFSSADDFLAGALFNDWTTAVSISATDISASDADNSINAATTDFVAQNIVEGQWIKLDGFTNAANNGYGRVESVTAGKVVLSGITLVNETAGNTVTVDGQMLRNGTIRKSFTVEKRFLDIDEYFTFSGMIIGGASFNIAANEILTGSFSFLGTAANNATTSIANSVTQAPDTEVLNAVTNFSSLREGGTVTNDTISSISLSINNNLRGLSGVGTLGHVDVGAGTFEVTGSLSVYFADGTLFNKYLNNVETSIDFQVTDMDGNTYIFTLARVKLSNGTVVAGGVNSDVVAEFDFQALGDQYTLQIDRFAS